MKIIKYNLLILNSFLCCIVFAQTTNVNDCISSIGTSAHGHMFSMLECDETLTISSNSTTPINISGNFETSKTIFISAGQSSVFIKPMSHNHGTDGDTSGGGATGRHKQDPKTRIKVPPPTSGFYKGHQNDDETEVITTVEETVILYPSPANHTITIEAYKNINTITIHNAHGVLVKTLNYTSQKSTINTTVTDLDAGIYFVRISLDNLKSYNKRMIKY